MYKVLRLPRNWSRSPTAPKRAPRLPRESKCCACHAKSKPRCTKCCACHAKIASDAQSAAPATQLQPEPNGAQTRTKTSQTVKMLRLPRKSSSRCTKYCACHAIAAGAQRRPNAHQHFPDSQSAAPASNCSRSPTQLTACHFLEGANPLPEAWHKVLSTNLRQKTQYESF